LALRCREGAIHPISFDDPRLYDAALTARHTTLLVPECRTETLPGAVKGFAPFTRPIALKRLVC